MPTAPAQQLSMNSQDGLIFDHDRLESGSEEVGAAVGVAPAATGVGALVGCANTMASVAVLTSKPAGTWIDMLLKPAVRSFARLPRVSFVLASLEI